MAKYLSGKKVCWLQLRADGHPSSYRQRGSATPWDFSELKGKNRAWLCPPRIETHNETREKEQIQLLDSPSHKRRLRKKKDLLTAPRNTVGGGSSSGKAAKPGLCLISNFKEENSSELIGPKPKYGQVWNMWSPQHPGGCESWGLTKATENLPLFFSLSFYFPFPQYFLLACLLYFGLWAVSVSSLFWANCIWTPLDLMVQTYKGAEYTNMNRNEGNIILSTVSHPVLIKGITSRFMSSITSPAVSRLYLSSNLIVFRCRLWKLPPNQR